MSHLEKTRRFNFWCFYSLYLYNCSFIFRNCKYIRGASESREEVGHPSGLHLDHPRRGGEEDLPPVPAVPAGGAQRLQLQLHPNLWREDGHWAQEEVLLWLRGRGLSEWHRCPVCQVTQIVSLIATINIASIWWSFEINWDKIDLATSAPGCSLQKNRYSRKAKQNTVVCIYQNYQAMHFHSKMFQILSYLDTLRTGRALALSSRPSSRPWGWLAPTWSSKSAARRSTTVTTPPASARS